MAERDRSASVSGKKYEGSLTEEQKKQLLRLAKELRKQHKKKKIPKILIWIAVILLILFAVNEFLRKDETSSSVRGSLSVHFIDVGQGDSVLISSGGCNMLIDCGESEKSDQVIRYLREHDVGRLDYVVATHPHSDHMGGMYKIISEFDVGEVIIPHLDDSDIPTTRFFEKFLDSCDRKGCTLTEAETGRVIAIGEARGEIIAPNSEKYGNLNNYSVGIFLTHGRNSFVMTGDAESSAEAEMIAGGRLRHATVLKAGHHGSSTSSSKAFIEAISPDHVVISCGEGNSYGHPNESAMKRMSLYTDKIYRTDLCGSIVFMSDGTELAVRTERNWNDNN